MKLFIQTAMIFLATLMTAAVVALGEPAKLEVAMSTPLSARTAHTEVSNQHPWTDVTASLTTLRLP
jgi:hypothetical protein